MVSIGDPYGCRSGPNIRHDQSMSFCDILGVRPFGCFKRALYKRTQ